MSETPDAIRPEWVKKAAAAVHVRYFSGRTDSRPDAWDAELAETVLAAVCGDIVEGARRDALWAVHERMALSIDCLDKPMAWHDGLAFGQQIVKEMGARPPWTAAP